MRFFFDSSAWIEYLDGSIEGEKIHKILQTDCEIFSLPIVISEVVSRAKRKNQNTDISFRAIVTNSKLFDVDAELSKKAGLLHSEMKKKKRDFGLIDAIIWVVSEKLNAKLVTKDTHFKDFKNVILLR